MEVLSSNEELSLEPGGQLHEQRPAQGMLIKSLNQFGAVFQALKGMPRELGHPLSCQIIIG
jgi:hypothetical protein